MVFLSAFALVGQPAPAPAPAPGPARPDPLMSLMLSQPPIDVTSPVAATSGFEPPIVRPGEDATYRVTFNALEESVEWPDALPASPKLQTRAGAHGQILVFGGSTLQPRTTFNYHVRSAETGRFRIPGFAVNVYGKRVPIPTAELEVVEEPPPAAQPAQRLLLKVPTTNLFVGESLRLGIISPPGAGLVSQGFTPLEVAGDGFLVDRSTFRQRLDPRQVAPGVRIAAAPAYELVLTPIRAGRLSAFAQGFFSDRVSGALIINGSGVVNAAWSPYTLLDSDPIELQVRPLPRDGQLPGFTGAVGQFSMDAPELSTNRVRVGDPVKLRVRVRGDGNLARLVAPPAPRLHDWQVFVPSTDSTHPQIVQAQGYTTFEFTLVPLSRDVRETPPVPFSYFDPAAVAYRDLTIPPVSIEVLPGVIPGDLQALAQAEAIAAPPEKEPVLAALEPTPGVAAVSLAPLQRQAWYPLLQLAPAGAFFGLWSWDRRRRYLEQHPDVVRRRRARRNLHRERRALERAARVGDASRFASLAVSALRIASAPHYPAEPRALVGADVLALFPDSDRQGRTGEVIRRFFAVTDAAQFAAAPPTAGELLALRLELNSVLEQLEERL